MKFSKLVNKISLCGSVILMLSSFGTGVASAKRVHHHSYYHNHTYRVAKWHHHKAFRFNHRVNHNRKHNHNHKINRVHKNNKNKAFKYDRLTWKYGKRIARSLGDVDRVDIYNDLQHAIGNQNMPNYQLLKNAFNMYSLTDRTCPNYSYYHSAKYQAKLSHYTKQDSSFDDQLRTDIMNNLNKSRVANHEMPLVNTITDQRAANYRIPHVQYAYDNWSDYLKYPHNTPNPADNWGHGEDTHTSVNDYFNYMHQPRLANDCGENAGMYYKNNSYEYEQNIPLKFNNTDPQGIANNIDYIIMNDDNVNHDGNNDGHKENELNEYAHSVGISVSYNPQAKTGVWVEDFNNMATK